MGSCYGKKRQVVIVNGFNVQTTSATDNSFDIEDRDTHYINEHSTRHTKPILEKLMQKNKHKKESSHKLL